MRYTLKYEAPLLILSVEESFTLIDFMALFACLLLGFFFAMFLWIFAAAIIIRLFTRREFHFDGDRYKFSEYIRIFSYFRIMRRSLSFSEIERFILSDYDSGKALAERGLINKEWFTLEIELKDRMRIRLMKTPYDEREELYEMNEEQDPTRCI